jgi:predicted DNA-binding transcriptional regulator AlpA
VTTYRFTLVIDGDAGTYARIDALFEAGCDDATFSHGSALSYGDFDREADSLLDAVLSAVEAVDSVEGLSVRRVDDEDLVTINDIADRLGRTRQSVNQLVSGERGDGTFPQPLSHTRGHARVWDWSEVAEWAGVECDRSASAVIRAVNGALALRRAGRILSAGELRRLLSVATAA